MFEGILLKPSMVTPGADSSKREKPEVVADYTLKLLRRRVPPAVPGEWCFHASLKNSWQRLPVLNLHAAMCLRMSLP